MQSLRKKNHTTSRKIDHATWVSEWEKSHNLSTHKNHATSPHTKSCNLSTRKNQATCPLKNKIMQPLHKKIMQALHKKILASSPQKNYATFQQQKISNLSTKKLCSLSVKKKSCKLNKNKLCNLSEWEKSRYLCTQKIMQPLHTQNHATSQQKKSCNLSTKTLRELQNAALRTSHRLSNVSNCSFQNFFFQ